MTSDVAGPVLVVGYGNPLRGDDGVGPAVATRLENDPRFLGADVRVQHQLTPELARDIAQASLVVLVDAGDGPGPGEIAVASVAAASGSSSAWSHSVDPAGLAGLARELWGDPPPVYTVSIGAASMDVGEGLSPLVTAAIPRAVEAVASIVGAHGRA